jgi:hypothetical protein
MRHAIGERATEEGLYAVEIHFGWKLLEWHAGAWWHLAKELAGGWRTIPCNGLVRCRRRC